MSAETKFSENYQAYLAAQKQELSKAEFDKVETIELREKSRDVDFSNAGPCNSRQ